MSKSAATQNVISLAASDAGRMAKLHSDAFPADEAWDHLQFEELMRQDNVICRAILQEDFLACAMLVQIAADQAEILTVATAQSNRRIGLAEALLHHFELELFARGLKKWLLDVAADNSAAIAFYQKNGFSEDGHRRGYYKRLAGNRVDAILMSKLMARQGVA